MTFITEVYSATELKQTYRKLALVHHPDKGGCVNVMQKINEEYSIWQQGLESVPDSLMEVKIGNTVWVNGSKSIVTYVDEKMFKAKSTITKREAFFEKETGNCLFNFAFKASVYNIWGN